MAFYRLQCQTTLRQEENPSQEPKQKALKQTKVIKEKKDKEPKGAQK